ncbi:hypothetical protein ABPG72_021434 [Tetrahymena utriculariae]
MQQIQQQKRQISAVEDILVGLSWEEVRGQSIDLDLQCVLLNDIGQIEDAVFYNQLRSKDGNVCLSEDSRGEKQGFDELLTIKLQNLPFGIRYVIILVCSYKGQPFKNAESANVQILQSQYPISMSSVGSQGNHLSFLPFIFEKNFDGVWFLSEVFITGEGKAFVECEALIKQGLVKSGFDEGLLLECKNWSGGKSFKIQKEDTLMIPESMKEIFVGLGWDTTCDIDSSLLLYDQQGNMIENIYFGNKMSHNGSIIHHGDDRSGSGSGDDEVITIRLDKVEAKIKCIWSVITIYTGGKQFDDVKGAFCRLVDPKSKKEFCKFNLSKNQDGVSTGCIMCCLTRYQNNNWAISPKGFYTKNTSTSLQVMPIITELMNGNFSNVKILNSKGKKSKTHQVTIIKATGLASFDSNGFSDPFVIFKKNNKEKGKTKIMMKNLNPVWNQIFKVNLKPNDKLEFRLNDYDRFTFNDFMGTTLVQVDDKIINSLNYDVTLQVQDKNFKQNPKFTGQIFINFKKIV